MGADIYVPPQAAENKEYWPFVGKMRDAKNIGEQAEIIWGLKDETRSRIMQELRNSNNKLDENRGNLLGALEALEALGKLEKIKKSAPMPIPATPKVKAQTGNASIKQPGAKPGTALSKDQFEALKEIYQKENVSYDASKRAAVVRVGDASLSVTGEKITIPAGKEFEQKDYETMIKAARELYGDELVLQHSDQKELDKMKAAFAAVKKSDLVEYKDMAFTVIQSEQAKDPVPVASTLRPGG